MSSAQQTPSKGKHPIFIVKDTASVQFTSSKDLIGVMSFSILSIQLDSQPYCVTLPLYLDTSKLTSLGSFATTGIIHPTYSWKELTLSATPLTFTISQGTNEEKSHTWTQIVFQYTSLGTPTVATFTLDDEQRLFHGQTGTCTFL